MGWMEFIRGDFQDRLTLLARISGLCYTFASVQWDGLRYCALVNESMNQDFGIYNICDPA